VMPYLGCLSHAGAAEGLRNQVGASAIGENLNYLTLSLPQVWILNADVVREELREQPTTVCQDARMGRATGSRTKNVFGNWEIEADDAILKEAQLILAEHPRDDETKGGE
jgi:hypothetical protein